MERMGIAFNRAPERRDDINLTIAFITDPAGTYIEITEGLADAIKGVKIKGVRVS
jgi:hypothetical protein